NGARTRKRHVLRKTEICMVQNVKKLRPELKIGSLPQRKLFCQREVNRSSRRPQERVSSQVAIGPDRRQREDARVVPAVRGTQYGVIVSPRLQVRTIGSAPASVSGSFAAQPCCKRLSVGERPNAAYLPTAQR